MHATQDIIIPATRGMMRGRLRRARAGRRVVLFFDGGAVEVPYLAELYDELSLYPQADGVTTLQMLGSASDLLALSAYDARAEWLAATSQAHGTLERASHSA